MHFVIGLGREKSHICLRYMVRYTGKQGNLPSVILKCMEHSANPKYSIDLGYILYRHIRFHIVNKITSKQSEYE